MLFRNIENQYDVANRLTEMVDTGRVGHAQMLLGPTASGSLALGLAYAQYLCCTDRQHYGAESPLRADSCGHCPSCRKYEELAHADLHLVFPTTTTATVSRTPSSEELIGDFRAFVAETKGLGTEEEWYERLDAGNKQGLIRERDAATIVRTLGMKSYEGGYKVVVVWMAERMNASAANSLLKTLEEPLGQTLIVLVAESRDRILPTVLSRVQTVLVPDRNTTLSPERRTQLAQQMVGWMRLLFRLNMQSLSAWVDSTATFSREKQKELLRYVQESVRACFLQTAGGIRLDDELDFGDPKFNAAFPAMITPRNVEQMNAALDEAQYALERNANPKITFMQLSFTLSRLIKNR